MKITGFILLAFCLQLSAKTGAQEKITLKEKGASLAKVLTEVQRQTGYSFFLSEETIKDSKPITIDVKNATLKQVLDISFKNQPFTYYINQNAITIIPKKNSGNENRVNNAPAVIDVSGKIMDENGTPAQGVNIAVKGTNKGTITNFKGEFIINGVDENAVLLITSVGYDRIEMPLNNRKFIYAQLKIAVGNLDELQVIAYGVTSKRLNTGNVASVKGTDIQEQPINNPLLALSGRVPGIFVTQSNGIPGGGINVRIQGQNSIANGNDPLYVVDGVPYFSQNLRTLQGGTPGDEILGKSGSYGKQGNPLSYINPADIESIEILKDADATSIYGSRAANGAILITTKKGKAGEMKVDINVQHGWGNVGHFIDLLNSRQYLDMRYEAFKNDNRNWMSPSVTANDLKVWDTTRNTDWQKVLIGGTAKYLRNYISVSGGTSNFQYLVGGTYQRETTVFPGKFSDKRGSIHFNLNASSANQKFKLQLSGNYMADKSNLPGRDFTRDIFLSPVAPPLFKPDGTLNWGTLPNGNSSFSNPLAQLFNLYDNQSSSLISNAIFSYRILSGLELRTSFGYSNLTSDDFTAYLINAIKPEFLPYYNRTATFSFNTQKSWIVEPQISYRKMVGHHKFDILIGSSIQKQDNDGKLIQASGQPNDQLLRDIKSATSLSSTTSDISQYEYNAVFARFNYNLADKYIVNLAGRRDGSSRFGNKNKFHNFGSMGLAWVFSQEKFVGNLFPFLSFGKLKGSYGITGSDQIGDYSYLNLYNALNSGAPYQGVPSLVPSGLSNPYLQWEETKKLQAGIELGFLSDKIFIAANYVDNHSSNQLLPYNLPNMVGFSTIMTNFPAKIQNKAWELQVTTNVNIKRIKWTAGINITIPKNRLLEFPDLASSSYNNILFVGKPLESFRLFNFLGVDPQTGLYLVSDENGQPTSTPRYPEDLSINYTSLPRVYGGFQNSFDYNGIQLQFLFQFSEQKNVNFYSTNNPPGVFAGGQGNQPTTVLARWRKPGDITVVQRYNSNFTLPLNGGQNPESLPYVRLKNVSLSYQISDRVLKKIHLKTVRTYINAQNLFTVTKYKGLDPETMSYTSLPPLRMITVGLQIGM